MNENPGNVQEDTRLRVDVRRQILELYQGGTLAGSYIISTSKFGTGFEPGSCRTPTGRFAIAEMIGSGAARGAVFKTRQPTGEIASEGGEEDLILTRILWLEGLEPSNANTRDRFIYIHGTNQESLLGTPASHGCIRMGNADVAELFERVAPGTPVEVVA